MRDFDRVRDKIEIRLEPRQVVMLAGATMIFSGLLFAAGFMLGRSRAPAPAPDQALAAATVEPEVADEVLDTATRTTRASAIGEVEFRFPSALGSRPARARSERPAMKLAGEVVAPHAEPAPAAKAEPTPAAKAEPAPVAKPEPSPAPIAQPEPKAAAKPAPVAPVAAAQPALRPIAPARAAPADLVDPPAPPIDEDDPDAAPPPAAPAAPAARPTPDAPGARYTLQVKAARDKAEADSFMAEIRAAGFTPHLVLADVPGKGRFYRVRVGRFASMADARAFQRRFKAESGQPDGGFVTDL
ncbi:MAG: SPOR domain-containing protein [bacterium]